MSLILALLGVLRTALGAHTDLVLENLALRQQLALLCRHSKRPRFGPVLCQYSADALTQPRGGSS
jgi:hypothetical protein